MSALSYKTRGNSSPQGKAKVYLSYHPSDAALLDGIIAEILAEVNCAVFFRDAEITDTEAHLHDLAEMNLTVIPISAAYLTKPSLARDTELPFFKAKHLPILPLMQEEHLDEEFTAVFGDLQYLDKNAKDTTAISYEEKFKTYLTSILVGDELAARIRQAFDAYIFLSYRKKDRVYAKELMRLIHENDFCRDIAIWYDEFLTPGEDFNDTIADALKKSTLFALAVTPNLVNERNYVMTVEYPMAKDENKTVLPVELVPTDRESLKNAYNGITEAIDSRDPAALQNALLDAFQWVMLRSHDDDPEHLYLIGLAYLSGIDVEKNASRALELITSAAERDYPDAIKKLVSMYENGNVIEKSYPNAIKWQERLVEISRERFSQTKQHTDAKAYLNRLWVLADLWKAIGRTDKQEVIWKDALSILQAIRKTDTWQWLERHLITCYIALGDIAKTKRDHDIAIDYYQKALLHCQASNDQNSNETASDLFLIYDRLANTYQTIHKSDEALPYVEKMLAIAEALAKVDNSPDTKENLLFCHLRRGKVAKDKFDYDTAEEHLHKALAYAEKLYSIEDSIYYFKLVITCLHECGMVNFSRTAPLHSKIFKCQSDSELASLFAGKTACEKAALDYHKAAFSRVENHPEIHTLPLQILLLERYSILAMLYGTSQTYIENYHFNVIEYEEKALRVLDTITGEEGTIAERRTVINTIGRLFENLENQGRIETAIKLSEKAIAFQEGIAKVLGTEREKGKLRNQHHGMVYLTLKHNYLDLAFFHAQKALALQRQVTSENPNKLNIDLLSDALFKLGDVYVAMKDNNKALKSYLEAFDVVSFEHCRYDTEANACYEVALLYKSRNQDELAQSYAEHAYRYWDSMTKQYKEYKYYAKRAAPHALLVGETKAKQELVAICLRFAKEYEKALRFDLALPCYQEYVELNVFLNEALKTRKARRELMVSYNLLGDYLKEREAFQEALDNYQKGMTIAEALHEEEPSDLAKDDLALSYYLVGTACHRLKNMSGRSHYAELAYAIWFDLQKRNPDQSEYKRRMKFAIDLLFR